MAVLAFGGLGQLITKQNTLTLRYFKEMCQGLPGLSQQVPSPLASPRSMDGVS